ncbi:hypothetical protein [Clostridium transplantifaecale]|uniref:hypothetical protein n=1 Tax=Clostridium transplantifaecale TaxID=2479838 RepID=UPI000F62E2D0|nr:hypothetical protein [Clostridium transplantifaecale]
MKAKVVGIQIINYTSKKTGQPVSGTSLHVEFTDAQVEGTAVDKVFLSSQLNLPELCNVTLNTNVDIEYNNRGYVQGLRVLK